MSNFIFYLKLAIYMIGSLIRKTKVEKIRKNNGDKAAEEYIYNNVLDWATFIVNETGVNIKVEGMENLPEGSCLYVSNHQSLFDIPVLLAGIKKPMGFIAKKELEKIKAISGWMKEIHCVFMDRSNVRESIKAINEGVENLKNGHSMVIFPEGTRSKGPSLGEFKKGSMKLAIKAEVPIVPIAIDGTYKAREGNKGNKITSADVKITIAKPINVKELTKEEKSNLSENIRNILNEILKYE